MITWLASYPRSGNTLLRAILKDRFGISTHSLYDDKTDIARNRCVASVVGHVSHGMDALQFIEKARSSKKNFLIKTHDAPLDEAKAIYVVRDGRSSIISYYHYLNEVADETISLRDVILGHAPFYSWSDHYRFWAPKERLDTLILRYEDLVKEDEEAVETLGRFLGQDPRPGELPSFEDLQKLDPRFFRAGSNEKNLEELRGEDLDLFWTCHGTVMASLGYDLGPERYRVAAADISSTLFNLRKEAVDQQIKIGERTGWVAELNEWIVKLQRFLEEERARVAEMNIWVNTAEGLLVEERERSEGLKQWAERAERQTLEARARADEVLAWAERSDALVMDERRKMAQLEERIADMEASLKAERDRTGALTVRAEDAEETLAKVSNALRDLQIKAKREREEWVELVAAISDRVELRDIAHRATQEASQSAQEALLRELDEARLLLSEQHELGAQLEKQVELHDMAHQATQEASQSAQEALLRELDEVRLSLSEQRELDACLEKKVESAERALAGIRATRVWRLREAVVGLRLKQRRHPPES